ncbi:Glycoside hydrolase/deacetylase beta/alpha-barrel [Penicillium cf. griseofulvum]|uniref:Glycoside hydrolase/deacetylase beta/alpha-barrel n=1 Tax=Penicillium cf. griseofulvum TaxID=2972120 RepID=A0A9W9M4M7_9EURO|nr:Glycoside hydrolase/deacetylase beta/alpha-barrel [Penicillium cf. griseofulvum]KAJ5434344.1 Glycoside hydrolase/deacetylase beta/alpha-barrel [Penicillium cf. griseofulvum]KAJ5452175.1 Glycoside hydrolase/deacetylase beta/alpha-barrel [Penicillium cf. griseofulvum]
MAVVWGDVWSRQIATKSEGQNATYGRINTNATDTTQLNISNLPVRVIITYSTIPGTITLTFVADPYIYTPKILDTLTEHGVIVTFFLNSIREE